MLGTYALRLAVAAQNAIASSPLHNAASPSPSTGACGLVDDFKAKVDNWVTQYEQVIYWLGGIIVVFLVSALIFSRNSQHRSNILTRAAVVVLVLSFLGVVGSLVAQLTGNPACT